MASDGGRKKESQGLGRLLAETLRTAVCLLFSICILSLFRTTIDRLFVALFPSSARAPSASESQSSLPVRRHLRPPPLSRSRMGKSQSKLSAEELQELQKNTYCKHSPSHSLSLGSQLTSVRAVDKKELQQWFVTRELLPPPIRLGNAWF